MNTFKYVLTIGVIALSFCANAQFSFTTNASGQCAPANVSFDNTSTSGVHFEWNFGDGSSLFDVTNPVHTYQYGGSFWVTMWAYDASFNYIGQTSQEVVVPGAPESMNIYSDLTCPGDEVELNVYIPGASNFSWNFDDGQGESGSSYVIHIYAAAGEYHPTVTFDVPGCGSYSVTDTITVTNSLPYFSQYSTFMSVSADSACPGDEIYGWTGQGYSSYNWDFGDGNSASGTDVQWTYSTVNNYNVSLTITNGCGVDTTLNEIVVVSNSTPVQNAQLYAPDTICPGQEFYIDVYGDNLVDYTWDMDDGSPAQTNSYFEYTYAAVGSYNISVTVTNSCGSTLTLYDTIHVTNQSPVSNPGFYVSTNTVCPGDPVTFGANSIYTYNISFGDGNNTVNSYAEHSYDAPGIYPITATIQNICGNSVTLYDTVLVSNNLPINTNNLYVSAYPELSCPGSEVEFYAGPGYSSYAWDFDDGTFGAGQEIDHIFNVTGIYNVVLNVENGCGATASIAETILIQNNLPVNDIDFSISADTICPGDNIFFQADNDDGLTYVWDLGDGTVTTDYGITHSYGSIGEYEITFTATNGCGNDSTIVDTIVVSNNHIPSANNVVAFVQDEGCVGDEMIFVIIPAGTGTISWDFGDGNGTSDIEQIFVQGIANVDVAYHTYINQGAYWATYSITNSCGNTFTDSIEVSVGGPGSPVGTQSNFFWDDTQTACQGEPVEFMAIGGATYIWDFGDGSGQLVTNTSLDPVLHTFEEAGAYTITLTSVNACGQTETSDETIFIPDSKIDVTTNTVVEPNCGMNNGMAVVSATGGTPPYTYSWTNGDQGVIADSLSSGVYVVDVTDLNECTTEATATVSDEEGVTILIDNVVDVKCYGDDNGSISVSILGGQPPYDILWSNGDQTEDIFGLSAGPYEIFVTDANGCFGVRSIEVSQPQKSNISIIASDAPCNSVSGNVTANINNGTPPYNYIWPNATGPSNQTSGLHPGVHSLLVIDGNTCLLEKEFVVNELGGPIIVTDSTFTGTCNGDLSDIYIGTIGGQAPFTYNWSNGYTNQDLIDVLPGDYTVEVSSANGCSSYQFYTVEESLPQQTSICMVDVDTTTNTNLIVWEPLSDPGIESYNIYKESSQAGLYFLIANQSADSVSQYYDYLSDPSIRSWRYKVAAVDNCGNEAELSDEHKTIHLTQNVGINGEVNLIWDHYEGFSYSTYYINRWHPLTDWEVIDSVSSSSISYTDFMPPSDSNLIYMISIQTPGQCTPAKAQDYNSSRSNKPRINMPDENLDVGLSEEETNSEVTVYPNPTNGEVTLLYSTNIKSIEIYDLSGKLVISQENIDQSKVQIDLSPFESGIYNFKLSIDDTIITGKIVKQ